MTATTTTPMSNIVTASSGTAASSTAAPGGVENMNCAPATNSTTQQQYDGALSPPGQYDGDGSAATARGGDSTFIEKRQKAIEALANLRSPDPQLRLSALNFLPKVAKMLGPVRVRTELIPHLEEREECDEEVAIRLASVLAKPEMVRSVGGCAYIGCLIRVLRNLSANAEEAVRMQAFNSMKELVTLIDDPNFLFDLISSLIETESTMQRITACGLIPPVLRQMLEVPIVGSDKNSGGSTDIDPTTSAAEYPHKANVEIDKLIRLFSDIGDSQSSLLRRVACVELPNLLQVLKLDPVMYNARIDALLHLLYQFAVDDQETVRIYTPSAARRLLELEAKGSVAQRDRFERDILPILMQLSEDKSWRVRCMVVDAWVQVVDNGGRLFALASVDGADEQQQRALPNRTDSSSKENAEESPGNIWNNPALTEMLRRFSDFLRDEEFEVRRLTLLRLPDFLSVLSGEPELPHVSCGDNVTHKNLCCMNQQLYGVQGAYYDAPADDDDTGIGGHHARSGGSGGSSKTISQNGSAAAAADANVNTPANTATESSVTDIHTTADATSSNGASAVVTPPVVWGPNGERAIEIVLPLLNLLGTDIGREIRSASAAVIFRLYGGLRESSAAVQSLYAMMKRILADDDHNVRLEALKTLLRSAPRVFTNLRSEYMVSLVDVCSSKDWRLRVAAIEEFANMLTTQSKLSTDLSFAEDQLVRILEVTSYDTIFEVRKACSFSLVPAVISSYSDIWFKSRVLSMLLTLRQSPNYLFRQQALFIIESVLKKIRDSESPLLYVLLAQVEILASDKVPNIRMRVAILLQSVYEDSSSRTVPSQSDKGPTTASETDEGPKMKENIGQRYGDFFLKLLENLSELDKDADVRYYACKALGETPNSIDSRARRQLAFTKKTKMKMATNSTTNSDLENKAAVVGEDLKG